MIITCITHANARDKSKHTFLGLTEQGWQEVNSAAKRFRLIAVLGADQGEEMPLVETVVSSPKARCLETAILFAKAISDFRLVATSEVQINSGLKAGSISGDELAELANSIRTQHLLVSAHADLARALPSLVELAPGAARDGWFTTRPVLFTIDYKVGESWDKARVLYCEGYIDEQWQGLIRS